MTNETAIRNRMAIADRDDMSLALTKISEIFDPSDEELTYEDQMVLDMLVESVGIMIEIWDYNDTHRTMDTNTRVKYLASLRRWHQEIDDYIYRYDDDAYLLAYSIRDALETWIECI